MPDALKIDVRQTSEFQRWLKKLKDTKAKAAILSRIVRIQEGYFGDAKYFEGIGELRFFLGPGYRVYFVKQGDTVVILLCAGDKASQTRDIERALEMVKDI